MRPLAVLAFGGNALLRSNQKGTYEEQFQNVENTCRQILPLIRWGYDIVICHGNGPQALYIAYFVHLVVRSVYMTLAARRSVWSLVPERDK